MRKWVYQETARITTTMGKCMIDQETARIMNLERLYVYLLKYKNKVSGVKKLTFNAYQITLATKNNSSIELYVYPSLGG